MEILEPLAAIRGEEGREARSEAEAGNTEISAPVSIKNGRWSLLQNTDSAPPEAVLMVLMPGARTSRPERFPRPLKKKEDGDQKTDAA